MRYVISLVLALLIGSAMAIPAAFAQEAPTPGVDQAPTFYGGDRN